jgi:hypothetical protein
MPGSPWRKSSFSGEVNCVEVAFAAGVRDSKNPAAGHLSLRGDAYRAFLGWVRGPRG